MEQHQNQDWKRQFIQQWDQQCSQINKQNRKSKQSFHIKSDQNSNKQIIHLVKPQDTLEGISIKYHVSVQQIKIRNNLSSNQIYFKSQIIVPNPRFISMPSLDQQRQEKVKKIMRKLHLGTQNKDFVISLLNETFWNVKNAIVKYYEDLQWQNKYADTLATFQNKRRRSRLFRPKDLNIC